MADAREDVVQRCIVRRQVVGVAGCHDRQVKLTRHFGQASIQAPIVTLIVPLQFKVEIVFAEDRGKAFGDLLGLVGFALEYGAGDLTAGAAGQRDQAGVIIGQQSPGKAANPLA